MAKGGGSYVAYVPSSYDKSRLYPLVVALHGAGDTAGNYLSIIWQGNADANGFLAIAPEASAQVGSGYSWDPSQDPPKVLAAVQDMYDCYAVDLKHVILNGFSAGAILAYIIGLKASEYFSGLAIASGDLGTAEVYAGKLLPSAWLIPVSNFQGDQDQNFPISIVEKGMQRLVDAGHPFFWHPFSGGHTTTAPFALQMYMDLKPFSAP
jgi:poly(3-hydroxybutyrate) depolymerase